MNTIDNILCINLESRKDRWSECVEQFKKLNIENLVQLSLYVLPQLTGCLLRNRLLRLRNNLI